MPGQGKMNTLGRELGHNCAGAGPRPGTAGFLHLKCTGAGYICILLKINILASLYQRKKLITTVTTNPLKI